MENNHIHNFTKTVVSPTCKENGYTLYKCECGNEHKEAFTPVVPHKYEIVSEVAPTCTQEGERNFRCKVCGEELKSPLPALSHAWGNWNIQKFPTCTEKGDQIRFCGRCGESQHEEIAPKGHKLTSGKKSETQKGCMEYFCENCGQTVTVPKFSQKAKNHLSTHKKVVIIPLVIIVLAVALFFSIIKFVLPYYHYNRAMSLMDKKEYNKAYSHFIKCADYKDSRDMISDFVPVYDGYTMKKDGKVVCKYKYEYDEYGNTIRWIIYDEDGEYECKYEYEYDEYENMTDMYQYDEDGLIFHKTEYQYYEDGNIAFEVECYEEEFYVKKGYDYDEYGNVTACVYYNEDETIDYTDKYEYEYDKYGKMTLKLEYDRDRTLLSSTKYEYDEYGNMTYKIICDEDGELESKYKYKYNEYGKLSSRVWYDENEKVYQEDEYDEYGNETLSVVYDEDGNVRYKYTYKYKNIRMVYKPDKTE